MRVALVHEFLTQLGGAERVLGSFHEIFPEAPVFTLVYDRQKTRGLFEGWEIRTSFLQNLPEVPEKYKWYLPLMPRAIESFDFSKFDLVLSDSSAFAKGAITKKPTIHICYCHTPTRYLWQDMDGYMSNLKYPSIVKAAAKIYLKNYLRAWDYRAAQRPGFFIANSKTVQDRIKKNYNRDSEVIYPPVDTVFFSPSPDEGRVAEGREGYYFTASRLESYKKIDLVVETFNELGWPLKVAGGGTETQSLKRKAKSNIEFLGRVSDEGLRNLYRGAEAFIFPAEEDAGIMVLEALSCGTPVVAYGQGGAAEFIRDGENGLLMNEQSVDQLFSIAKRWSMYKFDPAKLRGSVVEFDKEAFKKKILDFIHSKLSSSPDEGRN